MNLKTGDKVLIVDGGPLTGVEATFCRRQGSGFVVTLDIEAGAYARGDEVQVGSGCLVPRRPWRQMSDKMRIAFLKAVARHEELDLHAIGSTYLLEDEATCDTLVFGGMRDPGLTLSIFMQRHLTELQS